MIHESNKVWYSTSAGRFGFPWAYEAQSNSLNAIRNSEYNFLIGVYPNFEWNEIEHTSRFDLEIERFVHQQDSQTSFHETVANWRKTKLEEIFGATVLHGTVVTINGTVRLQYLDDFHRPMFYEKLPNSLWNTGSDSFHSEFASPRPTQDIGYLDEAILVSSVGDNFYHFVSESLRVLVLARISGVDCNFIVARNNLPEQFYELIQIISPGAKIVKVGKNESIKVGHLYFAQFERPLSQDPRFFFDMELSEILHSDEYLVWKWIREKIEVLPDGSRRVFLPRGKYESRGLLNSTSLESKLVTRGFEVINQRNMGARAQIQLFRNTNLFFSATGAGLLNTIFMPARSTLIELKYPTGVSWEFLPRLFDIEYDSIEISKLFTGKIFESLDVYVAPTRAVMRKLSEY